LLIFGSDLFLTEALEMGVVVERAGQIVVSAQDPAACPVVIPGSAALRANAPE
jgi:hypothetical protein